LVLLAAQEGPALDLARPLPAGRVELEPDLDRPKAALVDDHLADGVGANPLAGLVELLLKLRARIQADPHPVAAAVAAHVEVDALVPTRRPAAPEDLLESVPEWHEPSGRGGVLSPVARRRGAPTGRSVRGRSVHGASGSAR